VASEAPLTAEQRKLRARVAIHTRHSRPAPVAPLPAVPARFEDEVDPDRVLHPAERARRAGHAYKAHLARVAFEASRALTRAAAG
jgi:hypothetical protein